MATPASHLEFLPRQRPSAGNSASWLSLVAATTAGLGPTAVLRAHVQADMADDAEGLRLVIQSYLPGQFTTNALPVASQKPVSSTQRAVTAAELRRGVIVDLVLPTSGCVSTSKPLVVAWVERGRPNLDFDARLARPLPGAPQGCAKSRGSSDELCARVLLQAS